MSLPHSAAAAAPPHIVFDKVHKLYDGGAGPVAALTAVSFDVRRGEVVDPQVYGDDVIVVETSGSRTAVREFIDKLGVFAMFLAL